MLDGFLRGEERTQDVQVELLVEVLFGDAFERRGLVNSGVVDEDVEPAECPLRLGEETLDVCLLRDVCLHRNGLAASAYNLRDQVVGALLARGVVDDNRCALRSAEGREGQRVR